ncbi:unnamed protein product [Coregonus sp. 'balchen']|nr:unnamed protein product [Coregonus sp. 'balchen']
MKLSTSSPPRSPCALSPSTAPVYCTLPCSELGEGKVPGDSQQKAQPHHRHYELGACPLLLGLVHARLGLGSGSGSQVGVNTFDYLGDILSYIVVSIPIFTACDLIPGVLSLLIIPPWCIVGRIGELREVIDDMLRTQCDYDPASGETFDIDSSLRPSSLHAPLFSHDDVQQTSPFSEQLLVEELTIKISQGSHLLVVGNTGRGRQSKRYKLVKCPFNTLMLLLLLAIDTEMLVNPDDQGRLAC